MIKIHLIHELKWHYEIYYYAQLIYGNKIFIYAINYSIYEEISYVVTSNIL